MKSPTSSLAFNTVLTLLRKGTNDQILATLSDWLEQQDKALVSNNGPSYNPSGPGTKGSNEGCPHRKANKQD